MSGFNKDSIILHSENESVILYSRIVTDSDVKNTNDTENIFNDKDETSAKKIAICKNIKTGKNGKRVGTNILHDYTKDANASFNTLVAYLPGGDSHKLNGLSANKPFDLNFLAVHSNEHVEHERNKCWKAFQNTFTASKIPIYTGKSNYTRPRLPFQPWHCSFFASIPEKRAVLSIFDQTFNAFEEEEGKSDNTADLHCIPENYQDLSWRKSSDPLADFVYDLRGELDTDQSLETKRVQDDVEVMISTVLKVWEQNYVMFKDFKLLKMGSTYEGTKIGKPDEFDFMIELPALSKSLVFEEREISIDPELRDVKVIDRSVFTDIYVTQDENENDKTFMENVWREVLTNMCNDLQENLLPGWKWLNTLSSACFFGKLALTQQLLWSCAQFSSLIVDVDICLAAPQRNENFETGIDFNQVALDKRRPGITDGTRGTGNECDYNHIILRSDGQARVTMAVREVLIWKMAESRNKRVLYRCIKLMITKYLPKTWNTDLYRLESIIPSYWLKTILFYMFTWYTQDKHWSDSYLPLRLVEVFFLLKECLKTNTLSSFFVPHNILKRIGEKEKYSKIEEGLAEINDNLCKLQRGGNEGLANLQDIGAKYAKENEEMLETNLYTSLVELLYFYGYNEYSSENMTAMKSFISVFLNDRIKMEGNGKTIKIWYDGSLMDIDMEIHERFKETQKYFCYDN